MFGRKNRDRIAEQDAEIADLAYQLHREQERANRIAGRLAATEGQLAAARIERATAQQERDGYREDALKYRRARANLIPGGPYRGKGSKPKPNGAAVQGASTHG